MNNQSISLINEIFFTTIWAIFVLALSSFLGAVIGWICGQKTFLSEISKRVFLFFIFWTAVNSVANFCIIWIIAVFATIGFQKAKQFGNQWQFAIVNIFLGMRLGLILFWVIVQLNANLQGYRVIGGLGGYITNASETGNISGLLSSAFCILIVLSIFGLVLNFLEKILLNRVAQLS